MEQRKPSIDEETLQKFLLIGTELVEENDDLKAQIAELQEHLDILSSRGGEQGNNYTEEKRLLLQKEFDALQDTLLELQEQKRKLNRAVLDQNVHSTFLQDQLDHLLEPSTKNSVSKHARRTSMEVLRSDLEKEQIAHESTKREFKEYMKLFEEHRARELSLRQDVSRIKMEFHEEIEIWRDEIVTLKSDCNSELREYQSQNETLSNQLHEALDLLDNLGRSLKHMRRRTNSGLEQLGNVHSLETLIDATITLDEFDEPSISIVHDDIEEPPFISIDDLEDSELTFSDDDSISCGKIDFGSVLDMFTSSEDGDHPTSDEDCSPEVEDTMRRVAALNDSVVEKRRPSPRAQPRAARFLGNNLKIFTEKGDTSTAEYLARDQSDILDSLKTSDSRRSTSPEHDFKSAENSLSDLEVKQCEPHRKSVRRRSKHWDASFQEMSRGTVIINGRRGINNVINGRYNLTTLELNGKPCYINRANGHRLCYDKHRGAWCISSVKHLRRSIAYCESNVSTPEQISQRQKWMVFNGEAFFPDKDVSCESAHASSKPFFQEMNCVLQ